MHYSVLPRVRDGALRYTTNAAQEQVPVLVGSAEWYNVLEQIGSFGFEDQMGRSFTARRSRRAQQWYWYAYRKRGKQLCKVYLGKTEQLEPARPEAAARELADLPREVQPNASTDPQTRPPADPLSAEQVTAVFLRSTKLRIPAPHQPASAPAPDPAAQTPAAGRGKGRIAFWPQADLLAYQAWIWLQCGELALAARWAQTADVRLDDPQIGQRRIEYWVYSEVLLALGQYEQAASLLGRLVQSATRSGTRTEPLLKLLVAYANALFAEGQSKAALPVLERALGLGQPEGYIRPFLDSAPRHTRALLEHYHQKTCAEAHIEAYVQQLLAESESVVLSTMAPAGGTTPAVTLSQREREILRLVEEGLSNGEIAHKLVIEANTVKFHLHRIYQRLSVRTRYQAVKHAKMLQML